MKANRLYIFDIKKKGEESILSSRKSLNIVAFLLATIMIILKVNINANILGVLISALAIFTGFFFTLIVYITDKSVSKIAQLNESQKVSPLSLAAKKFKQSYIDFTKKIISQISYSILLSVFLIIIAFITQVQLFKITLCEYHIDITTISRHIFTFIFCFLTIRLLFFILVIIGNMQSFFYSEIDQVQDKYKT